MVDDRSRTRSACRPGECVRRSSAAIAPFAAEVESAASATAWAALGRIPHFAICAVAFVVFAWSGHIFGRFGGNGAGEAIGAGLLLVLAAIFGLSQ